MAPKLFMKNESGPAMSVIMTAKMLGVDLETKVIVMENGDHLSPEFIKVLLEIFHAEANNAMAPKLYVAERSPFVASVRMTAKALGLQLEIKIVDTDNGEHKTPEFLKMNPQHTVPTLDDDGYYLWDSHAINAYLVNKYGKDDSLYPKDPQKRGTVDQRLHFNNGVLYPRLLSILMPKLKSGENVLSQEDVEKMQEVYQFLEAFLEGKKWVAGDSVTIADISIVLGVYCYNVVLPIDQKAFPRLTRWFKQAQELPYYDVTQIARDHISNMCKSFELPK
ncbi:glutathione S-transferase [Rhyzopertha dominica]|nr:glutathione S-transferase [Rhyzopertha dominica]